MARLQHTESTFSATVRGALTGFVLAAVATVGLAAATGSAPGGTPGGTVVELRVDTAKVEVASATPVIPFLHSAPVRPAA